MICNLKFRCYYLKNVALDFVLLVLKIYPIQFVISLPLWIKLTMGQLLLFFLRNFSSIFSYVEGVLVSKLQTFFHYYRLTHFGYLANYNIRETFLSIFLICSKMMNCLRSLGPNRSPKKNINKNYQTIFRPYFYFL